MAKKKQAKKFIKVKKGDEVIEVHPSVLAQHEALGWVRVEKEDIPAKEDSAGEDETGEENAGE